MYSFNPGNQFALGNKKYQILEILNEGLVTVSDTVTGISHTMATEELYDQYEKGDLFFFKGHENLEEKTLKKLLNPTDGDISVEKRTVYTEDYLKRDPFTYTEEEIEIVEFKLAFIDGIIEKHPKALTEKHIKPIIDSVFEDKYASEAKKKPSHHTVRKWYEKYVKNGRHSSALLPRDKDKGNRNDRFEIIREIIDNKIKEIYLTRNQNSVADVHEKIKKTMILGKIECDIPTYKAIRKRIRKMEDMFPYEVMCAREGKVAANEKFRGAHPTYQEKRALECVEVDSTKLDLFVLYWNGKPAGRPWLTIVRDRYTQCITGFYLGFEPPSILSLSKALKHSFMRKHSIMEQYPDIKNTYPCFGLPDIIVCDNGKEYWSKAFKLACRDLGIIVNYAPVRSPNIKGGVESFFKTLNNDLLHKQSGTTFSNIFERKDYDPEKNAVIRFESLVEIFYTWIVDVYHQDCHKGEFDLKMVIPQQRWLDTITTFPPILPSKESFDFLFGQVEERTLSKKGIEIDYMFYHSAELNKLRQKRGNIKTIIKLDPEDMSKIYVYDEVTEKYIIAYCLLSNYSENLTRWQHKNNIRMSKVLAGKVDEKGLAEADERIQKLVQECFTVDDSVSAKSKVSRYIGLDNENPNGRPARKSGASGAVASAEILSGCATDHEIVLGSDIISLENTRPKKEMARAGFSVSSRLQEKINGQENNS